MSIVIVFIIEYQQPYDGYKYNHNMYYNNNGPAMHNNIPSMTNYEGYHFPRNPYSNAAARYPRFPLASPYAQRPPDMQGDWSLPSTVVPAPSDGKTA